METGEIARSSNTVHLLVKTTALILYPAFAMSQSILTQWGDPDLQGIWSNPYATPLERPMHYGEREFLNANEIAAAEQDLLRQSQQIGRDSREGRGTERDVARAYNDHWRGDPSLSRGIRTSMIVSPSNGQIPELTPEAQARVEAKNEYLRDLLQGTSGGRPGPISPKRFQPSPDYNLDRINRTDGPEDRSSMERCFGFNMPLLMQSGTYGGVARIIQSRDFVGIYYDVGQGQGFSRIIPISNTPHLPNHIRQRYGDARAHWEGEVLVVDIANFTNKTNFHGSRENLHLIERYQRLDSETLSYQVTVEDPTTFIEPFTIVQELTKNRDEENQVYEAGCHEGNYGMIGMLTNTRAAERAFAEGRGPDPATQDNATGGITSWPPAETTEAP
jgi:hypothetical protein